MVSADTEGILGGLKNAIERGADLEKAKLTFLNAGYSEADVDEAIKLLPETIKKTVKLPQLNPNLKPDIGKPLPEIPKIVKSKKSNLVKTILIGAAVIVFVLIVILVGAMFLSK